MSELECDCTIGAICHWCNAQWCKHSMDKKCVCNQGRDHIVEPNKKVDYIPDPEKMVEDSDKSNNNLIRCGNCGIIKPKYALDDRNFCHDCFNKVKKLKRVDENCLYKPVIFKENNEEKDVLLLKISKNTQEYGQCTIWIKDEIRTGYWAAYLH